MEGHLNEFRIQFYQLLSHIGDPALIFAAGAASGLILFILLSKIKKYFAFILALILIAAFSLYISGKKLSDLKNISGKKIESIEDKARDNVKGKIYEKVPGMK